jgi:hypothetical protein
MFKKKVVIVAILTISTLLNGMQSPHKKVKKTKSGKTLQELTVPEEDNALNRNSSQKLPVKNLNDIKEMRRVQSEFRDKAALSKSESSVDKK